jgi:hypothetical protein
MTALLSAVPSLDGERPEVAAKTFRLFLTGGRSTVSPTIRIWCRLTSPLRSLVHAGRVALLLVVVACSTPERAAAECGDYVTILNGSQSATHAAPVSNLNPEQSPAKPPCHGPNCSSSPAREFPPVPPAPTTSTSTVKESARNSSAADTAAAALGSPFDRDLTSPLPIHRASSIFHPPRLG